MLNFDESVQKITSKGQPQTESEYTAPGFGYKSIPFEQLGKDTNKSLSSKDN